ncbi:MULTISPECIES: PRD domain-containing protein [Clostridium]|uniref:PRD domain-containing protein n=1 Tax=Clostridium TaxID=1485 RepID=UPI00189834D0|nr:MULTISPECIES: PRD domain-containing protein [Clostridium]MCR1951927.1 PRD domain-containing protein [Clostridium sp. DSM 100503]MDI9217023.1 PRD domain-containing protein [Clostridium tertium]
MELTLRLDILRDSGQLSKENYNKIIQVINYFEEKRGVKLLEENASMFITHLCSALGRIDENNLVNKLDDVVAQSLKENENYDEALKVVKDLESIIGEIPDSELDFVVMHVCTLI